MYKIYIDYRERVVIPILKKYKEFKDYNNNNITWEETTLTVGDYIIFNHNKALCIIERKTWADLAASLLDGRKENVNKLLQYREKTGSYICYLIEGPPIPASTTLFCRVPYKNLLAHLDHLIFRDNIHILYSKDIYGTIDRIFSLVKNISSIKKYGGSNATDSLIGQPTNSLINLPSTIYDRDNNFIHISNNDLDAAKIKFVISDENVIKEIYTSIPGINHLTYKLFSDIHIYDLLTGKIDHGEISKLKYTNGKILGIKRANKILNAINNKCIHIKILSKIPKISKKNAIYILESFTMKYMLENWINIKDTIKNMKPNIKKLGNCVVDNIEKYLVLSK